jgi:hypothetical protein
MVIGLSPLISQLHFMQSASFGPFHRSGHDFVGRAGANAGGAGGSIF